MNYHALNFLGYLLSFKSLKPKKSLSKRKAVRQRKRYQRLLKILFWRYYCGGSLRRIAELDGEGHSHQAIDWFIKNALTKMKREIKHIRGLSKVLNKLADELERKGKFDREDLDLLKKVGSDILFKGVALGYTEKVSER